MFTFLSDAYFKHHISFLTSTSCQFVYLLRHNSAHRCLKMMFPYLVSTVCLMCFVSGAVWLLMGLGHYGTNFF